MTNVRPKSADVAKGGLNTGADFARFMGALMGDLVEGNIEPAVAAAACKAGTNLLKVIEMQQRHGRENRDGTKTLQLTDATIVQSLPSNT